MIKELRIYIAELLLSLALDIVPIDTDEGKMIHAFVNKYCEWALNKTK